MLRPWTSHGAQSSFLSGPVPSTLPTSHEHGYQAQGLWALAEGSLDACTQRCDLTHTVGITSDAHEPRDPRVGASVIIVDTTVWVEARAIRKPSGSIARRAIALSRHFA